MSWGYRGNLPGSLDWQYTQDIASPLIRVSWTISPALLYTGLIARVRRDLDGKPQYFGIRRIYSQPQTQILDFNLSDDLLENSEVAFKVTRGIPSTWNILVESWNSPTMERRLIDITQADLVDDKVIVNHNLSTDYVHVNVYDSNRNSITPYNVREIDNQNIELDFTGLTPLIGIYKVSIRP